MPAAQDRSLPRWLLCLSRQGAALGPCITGGGYGVFAGGDRRRRPLARLDAGQLRQALASGMLEQTRDGIELGQSGRAAIKRGVAGSFAAQHRIMDDREILGVSGRLERVRTNIREDVPGRWAVQLEPQERAAAERFCTDYARSSLRQHTTRNWSLAAEIRQTGWHGGPESASLAAIAAKDRVMDALDALGSGMDQLVVAVCIREESLAAVERRFGWAQRSGKTVLKLALQQLARHYGLNV
ncbi:DUF6456 domain-containing protein [Maricaulis salignorans]|uniref:DUF6456 domain-containing protein n=1 Tax=Maricaulis salignorans TaxID=144026 RepID=A0A1G9Q6S2_9PROT|nr:DUF6456 domain-containing protein [Maricaulis salignorans]SDM06045.1 hypothetical protein SAMN04488568_104165 [Maricaulis salignorans]